MVATLHKAIVAIQLALAVAFVTADETSTVTISWEDVTGHTTGTPTFQNSVDPYYRMDDGPFASPIAKRVFELEKDLKASYVRHVPWFPYPCLAVAELFEPDAASNRTFWDFSLIDPITNAFVDAMEGRPIVMNFATIPQWMFSTAEPVPVKNDPNERDVSYEQGTDLRDPTMKELVGYFRNLYSYYCLGGFTDELGHFHKGYNYKFEWFEIFNEPESEHSMTPQQYTERYDAIVTELRTLFPDAKFMGLGLGGHNEWDWYNTFLNQSNHQEGIPIDGFSAHFYAIPSKTTYPEIAAEFFTQADTFLQEMHQVVGIREKLQPQAKIFINEIGCAFGGTPSFGWDDFWTLCGSMYSYLYSEMSIMGVEFSGQSQMIGFVNGTYNTEWPSTSMVDWTDGSPNARYLMLQLLIDNFGGQPTMKDIVQSSCSDERVYAQGFVVGTDEVAVGNDAQRVVLLINKGSDTLTTTISLSDPTLIQLRHGADPLQLCWVDASTAPGPYKCKDAETTANGAVVTLTPSMVAVLKQKGETVRSAIA